MTEKMPIPMEAKYQFSLGGWADTAHRGLLYAIREKYGAAATLEIVEWVCNEGDRAKNNANLILEVFKIDGNDCETIDKWWDIWGEIFGYESTKPELSKTLLRYNTTKCPWKTVYKDISDWTLIWTRFIIKTINPKATVERPKAMCAGDPYCDYIYKVEE